MTVLNADQLALRDAVRELADDKIAPRAAEIDQSGEFPWDVVELLAAHDFFARAVSGRVRRPGRGHDLEPRRDRGAQPGVRHERPHPGGPGARLAAAAARRHRRAEAALDPRPGGGQDAGRLRADRGRGRLRCGQRPHQRDTRRRRLGHQRREALHQPGRRRRVGGRLRRDRQQRRVGQGPSPHVVLLRREGHARLQLAARRAQDGHPRLDDGRAGLCRRARCGRQSSRRGGRWLGPGDEDVRAQPAGDRRPGSRHRPGRSWTLPPATRPSASSSASRSGCTR